MYPFSFASSFRVQVSKLYWGCVTSLLVYWAGHEGKRGRLNLVVFNSIGIRQDYYRQRSWTRESEHAIFE